MKALTHPIAIRQLQGFAVYVSCTDDVELAMVPELGAKIVSLKNLRTGREWLWHPQGGLKLFKNPAGDAFARSPLAGIDECVPTILPCLWRGRDLPDHGEAWNVPWEVDRPALESGVLRTSVPFKISPLLLTRSIEMHGNEVRLDYTLKNLSAADECFVWAIHPLLCLEPEDRLELPDSTRKLFNGEGWVDDVASAVPEKGHAKIFARAVSESWAAVKNVLNGDRLEFSWDASENDTLGLWLTRGGWHGHHHFAIETTNASDDSLAAAAVGKHCGLIRANGTASWRLVLRVGE